jgi:hypothetical protein
MFNDPLFLELRLVIIEINLNFTNCIQLLRIYLFICSIQLLITVNVNVSSIFFMVNILNIFSI